MSAIIGAGIVPGRDRDDGRAGHRGGRGGGRTAATREGAGAVLIVELDGPAAEVERQFDEVERHCREQRRVRDPDRRRRRRAGAVLEGPQVGVRRGRPDQPRLHRPGRRHPADRAARGAAPDRRAVRRAPASGSPTSSTPATATCTRWCSSTTRSPGQAERGRGGVRRDPRPLHRARRLDHRRARRRRRTRRSTCRGCSPTTTSTRCSCCAARSTRHGLSNPGKVFPTPRLCGEVPGRHQGAAPAAARPGWRRCSDVARRAPGARTTCRRPADGAGRPRPEATRSAVSAPATSPPPASTEEVAAVLRVAAEHDLAVVPRGAGTKLGWGAPPTRRRPACSTPRRLDGVVEHAAGDLVVVVRAGTPARRPAGRRSPRPASSWPSTPRRRRRPSAGRVATSTSGPAPAAATAPPRDLLIGITRARRRRGRQGRRQGRQERRRLRPRQAAHRLLRHARRDHRGRLPAAPAAGRAPAWSPSAAPTPRRPAGPRSAVLGSQVVPTAVELDQAADGRGPRSPCCSRASRPAWTAAAARVLGLLGAGRQRRRRPARRLRRGCRSRPAAPGSR